MGKKRERNIYAYLGPSRGFRAVVVAAHQAKKDDLLKRTLSFSDRPAHYFIRDECVYVCVCVMHILFFEEWETNPLLLLPPRRHHHDEQKQEQKQERE